MRAAIALLLVAAGVAVPLKPDGQGSLLEAEVDERGEQRISSNLEEEADAAAVPKKLHRYKQATSGAASKQLPPWSAVPVAGASAASDPHWRHYYERPRWLREAQEKAGISLLAQEPGVAAPEKFPANRGSSPDEAPPNTGACADLAVIGIAAVDQCEDTKYADRPRNCFCERIVDGVQQAEPTRKCEVSKAGCMRCCEKPAVMTAHLLYPALSLMLAISMIFYCMRRGSLLPEIPEVPPVIKAAIPPQVLAAATQAGDLAKKAATTAVDTAKTAADATGATALAEKTADLATKAADATGAAGLAKGAANLVQDAATAASPAEAQAPEEDEEASESEEEDEMRF